MTKDEAEREVERLKLITSDPTFCPLIKDYCNHQCVCYLHPRLRIIKTDEYGVYPGRCDNCMFHGDN